MTSAFWPLEFLHVEDKTLSIKQHIFYCYTKWIATKEKKLHYSLEGFILCCYVTEKKIS